MVSVLVVMAAVVAALLCAAVLATKALLNSARCVYSPSLAGKVAVVTGSTSGIGLATAARLAELGATVVLANRSEDRSRSVAESLSKRYPQSAVMFLAKLDLSDLRSVEAFATAFMTRFGNCDILVCNAGVMMGLTPATSQGLEPHYGVNFLAHFHLVTLLLPALERARGRVVALSSSSALLCGKDDIETDNGNVTPESFSVKWSGRRFVGGIPFLAYSRSKLAIVVFIRELQRRYPAIVALSNDPGVARTNITSGRIPWLTWLFQLLPFATAEESAQTVLHCALAPASDVVPGALYRNCRAVSSPVADDLELASRLWEKSVRDVKHQ